MGPPVREVLPMSLDNVLPMSLECFVTYVPERFRHVPYDRVRTSERTSGSRPWPAGLRAARGRKGARNATSPARCATSSAHRLAQPVRQMPPRRSAATQTDPPELGVGADLADRHTRERAAVYVDQCVRD